MKVLFMSDGISWDLAIELIVVEYEGYQVGAEAKIGRKHT
jgi:hypothetical protein